MPRSLVIWIAFHVSKQVVGKWASGAGEVNGTIGSVDKDGGVAGDSIRRVACLLVSTDVPEEDPPRLVPLDTNDHMGVGVECLFGESFGVLLVQHAHRMPRRMAGAGRDYYDKKVAEGKTSKEAIRALKRRISDVVYRHLVADTKQSIS